MTSILFFIFFVPVLGVLLLALNFIFAPHKPYKEKKTPFECGYHSFILQTRTPFTISFFTFGFLFIIFDGEIVVVTPMTVCFNDIEIYGILVVMTFLLILTLGFVFEIGNNALNIDTKQGKVNLNSSLFTDIKTMLVKA